MRNKDIYTQVAENLNISRQEAKKALMNDAYEAQSPNFIHNLDATIIDEKGRVYPKTVHKALKKAVRDSLRGDALRLAFGKFSDEASKIGLDADTVDRVWESIIKKAPQKFYYKADDIIDTWTFEQKEEKDDSKLVTVTFISSKTDFDVFSRIEDFVDGVGAAIDYAASGTVVVKVDGLVSLDLWHPFGQEATLAVPGGFIVNLDLA